MSTGVIADVLPGAGKLIEQGCFARVRVTGKGNGMGYIVTLHAHRPTGGCKENTAGTAEQKAAIESYFMESMGNTRLP